MLALAYFSHGLYQASTGRVASQMELVVKNPPASTGDIKGTDSIPGSERSPGEGNGYPLQYSCLENSMDRGAWWVAVHGVSEESDATEQVSRQIMSNVEHLFMCLIVINLWPFNLSSQILFCSLRSSFWKLDFSV